MKFSILIAHYNNFHYFQDCYQSIINQTYQDFEVIIVDDCSTDDSLSQIETLVQNDIRFKIYKNTKNQGVGYTKKRCINLSSGDVCGFLDPDDTLVKNAIETSINTYSTGNFIATYSQFYLCDAHLKIQKIFPNTKKIKNGKRDFLNINFEVAHFFTFKREHYYQTEGIMNYKIAEDQDLYLKLYEKGNFAFIPQPLLLYRLHDKGLSHNKEKIKLRNETWHIVLKNALNRRNITKIYGKKVFEIENLPHFIFQKENTFFKKLLRFFL